MTKAEMQAAFEAALKTAGVGKGDTGFGKSSPSLDALPSLSSAVKAATPGFETLKNTLVNNIDTWKKLSSVGANFSNDVLGMSTAAMEARMSLRDFAGLVTTYNKSFSGLGVGVSRGTEAFAKLSKNLQDSNISKDMMNLGYTTTEINELLALQVGFQRTKFSLDKQGQDREFAAIKRLATEMDLLAKLTGNSREEMMEKLKEEQKDAAIQARIREMAQKNGMDIQTATKLYQENLLKAQSMGMEKSFKDVFASGGIRSQASAAEATAGGAAGAEVLKSALALRQGDFKASEERMTDAMGKIVERNNQSAFREMVTRTGGGSEISGPVEEAAAKQYMASLALTDAVEKIKKEKPGVSTQEAIQLAFQELRKSQAGQDDKGKKVSQITEAAIETEKFYKDVNASVGTGIKAFREQLDKLATAVKTTAETIQGSKGGGNIRKTTEDVLTKSLDPTNTNKGVTEQLISGINGVSTILTDGVKKGIDSLNATLSKDLPVEVVKMPPVDGSVKVDGIGRRATGGFIGKPEISAIGEEGPEWVLNKEQMAGTLEDAANKGIEKINKLLPPPLNPKTFAESMTEDVSKRMKDMGLGQFVKEQPKQQGINLNEISNSIKTSVSSVSGGGSTTTTRKQSDESKTSEKELSSVKKQYAEERTALATKFKEMMPDASVGDRRRAMNASDESSALNAKYEALMKPLEKKIEEGITYEVEKKQDALAQTKQLVEEQSSIVTSGVVKFKEKTSELYDVIPLTEQAQDFFNVIKTLDEESLQLKEGGYKKQIEANIANIKKADEEIASVKSELENATTTSEKRRLGHRLASLEKEKAATEDAKKFSEEQLNVVELAIKSKKSETSATEELVTATDKKIEKISADVKSTQDLVNSPAISDYIDEGLGELGGEMKKITEEMYPDTEFGDLAGAIKKVEENTKLEAQRAKEGFRKSEIKEQNKETPSAKEGFRKSEIKEQNKTEKKIPSMNEMIQDLAKASGVKDVNKIQTGQKIKLPDGTDYTVKQGDTLSKIAQQTIKDMKSKIAAPNDKPDSKAQQSTKAAGQVADAKSEEAEKKKAEAAKSKEKSQSDKSTESESGGAQQAKATLDDVVRSLELLNRMMSQMISVSEDLGKQQISALKSNSSNIFERY